MQLAGSQRLIKGICCLWSYVITTFNSDIYLFTGSDKLPSMSAFVNVPIGVYCIIDRIAAQKMLLRYLLVHSISRHAQARA